MEKMSSYAILENHYLHEMRKKFTRCEDVADLKNNFSFITTNLLRKACNEDALRIAGDDIRFDSGVEPHYLISDRLRESSQFREKWDNSDLPDIVKRFASCAYKHYLHMMTRPLKSEIKIRN